MTKEKMISILKWMNSKKGKISMTQFVLQQNVMIDEQLERFKKTKCVKLLFGLLVNKIVTKYNLEKTRLKWADKGIEPPEDLYWYLYFYARKYGTKSSQEEYDLYCNDFVSKSYTINDYLVCRVDRRGSCIKIIKIK